MYQRKPATFFLALALLLSSFLAGYAFGFWGKTIRSLAPTPRTSSASVDFRLLDDVWGILRQRYAGSLDQNAAVYGAIRGLVESLKDPYTVFFTPDEAKQFQDEIQGTFSGIGAEIGMKDDQLVVIAPLPGSPAERSGLAAGDSILQVDGIESTTLLLDEAVSKIRGEEGTTVVLTIRKEGQDEQREYAIKRETITVKSVKTDFLENGIALITLSYFGPNTDSDFQAATASVMLKGSTGLILDMRSNPGGYLDAAVSVAGHFLHDGATVVIEETSDGERTTLQAESDGDLLGFPVVVLVDQGSASGSEIVAGALQDHKVATLVGVTSFGKGSVQQLEDLPDGSNLKVTVAKWLTPQGRSIHEHGITPDVVVELTDEDLAADRDPQLERAKTLLLETAAPAAE